jgi:hypothetical protein
MINKINKIVIITILFTTLVFARSTPHVLSQIVLSWPAGIDETGVQWMIYDLYNAETHYLDQDSAGSYTSYSSTFNALTWAAECGNLPNWHDGDTIIAFGSWDSEYAFDPDNYGSNVNHTGFYWLFSDTLDEDLATQYWFPQDTLRVLPKPIVSKTGSGGGANDTIWVKIPNPMETDTLEPIDYSVLGYWLVADSTGAGTPDALNDDVKAMEIGFIPVQGDTGDTTVYSQLESEGFLPWNHWTTYFAYKLVARPSFSLKGSRQAPGHTTYYFSQNSDAIDVYQIVIGIEENKDINHSSVQLEISPNPFTDRTDITCSIGQSAKSTELRIYDISGKLVKDFSLPIAYSIVPTVSWYGTDESGELLPSGVYFIQAKGGDLNLTKKVILQR